MTDINLLRWRETTHGPLSKNGVRVFVIVITVLLFIFSVGHIVLYRANAKLTKTLMQLKHHMTLLQTSRFENNNVQTDLDEVPIKLSQKKVWQCFNAINCLSEQGIHINKITYQSQQIYMMGWVESPMVLAKALEFCWIKNTKISAKKITFSQKNNRNFLQFSILAV